MKTKSVVLKEFQQLLLTKYSSETVKNYIGYTSHFLSHTKNPPLRVTNDDFLNYNVHLATSNIADSTRNVAINAVKCYFKMYLNKKVKEVAALRPKKQSTVPQIIPHNLLLQKINAINNLKHRLIIKLGYCGLRSGEVINLKLLDIDVEAYVIKVFGKGKKERIVPISEKLVFEILAYYDEYFPETYLFNGQTKLKYSAPSIRNLVKKYIGNYRFHDLRHSFATRLLETGTDIKYIKELLGHKHLKTTEIYTHVSQTALQRIAMPV